MVAHAHRPAPLGARLDSGRDRRLGHRAVYLQLVLAAFSFRRFPGNARGYNSLA